MCSLEDLVNIVLQNDIELEDVVENVLQEGDDDLDLEENVTRILFEDSDALLSEDDLTLEDHVIRLLTESEEEDENEDHVFQIGGRGDVNPARVHLDFNGREFNLRSHWIFHNERFGVDGIAYNFVVSPNFSPTEVFESFDRLISEIYDFMRSSFHPNDYVEVFVTSNEFRDGGFSIPLVQVRDLDERVLFDRFGLIVQSNEDISLDDGSLRVEIYHVNLPSGGGYSIKYLLSSFSSKFEKVLSDSKCLFNVPRKFDPFCGVVALILALRLANGGRLPRPERIKARRMRRMCTTLLREAGLPLAPLNLEGIKKIAKLDDYLSHPICVISREHYNTPILNCNRTAKGKPIILYLADSHFYLVKSVNTLLGREGRLCLNCFKFLRNRVRVHKCDKDLCLDCKCFCSSDKEGREVIQCPSCFRIFKSRECFDNHLTIGKSVKFSAKTCVCENLVACRKCGRDLKAKNGVSTGKNAYVSSSEHQCYMSKCSVCKKLVDLRSHYCYLQPLDPSDNDLKTRLDLKRGEYCFFDIETMKVYDEENNRHILVPNLVVFQFESGEERVFAGENCMEDFTDFLFFGEESLASSGKYYTLIGHNTARFDSFYLLQQICEVSCKDPNIFFDGKVPLRISFSSKFQVIDSFRFFQCSLDKLPKTFNLSVKKGMFPHEFNVPENQNYVGVIPPSRFFGTKFMKKEKFQEFEEWYLEWGRKYLNEEIGDWDFQKELLDYCRDDVNVLRLSWLSLWKAMYEITGFHIGIENCTAASFTNLVWRSTIPPFKIGLIPKNNYCKSHTQSESAKTWLIYQDLIYYAGELEYSGKGNGERSIKVGEKMMRVDGYHEESNDVLEFLGCNVHGCNKCYSDDYVSFFTGKSMILTRMETQERIARLKNEGYNVHYIWECEWNKMKKNDVEVRDHLEMIDPYLTDLRAPINPREALFGGRTETICLFKECDLTKECIKADDFTSLYPTVMKQEKFPIGHPVIIRGVPDDFDYSLDKYFGIMRCRMLPPDDLFHPVLPKRFETEGGSEKLIFSLCGKCAREQNFTSICSHSRDERSIEAVWVSVEVYKAVRMGYEILEIFEVWDYRGSEKGLFAPFVDKFLKIKQENSGWPRNCESEEDKQNYIQRYEEHEGIKLDYDKIKKDPVMRFVSKILLNSCWGFWARNLDRRITRLTHEPSEFFDFVTDETMRERVFRILNPKTILCHGYKKSDCSIPNRKGNVVQAAFVTAYARLRLYELLEKLGPRALYMDTDSVFFVSSKDEEEFEPELGEYLGDLTNVLEDEKYYDESCVILRYCSGGPKHYGYDVFSEERGKKIATKFKIRGIGLNRTTEKKVNFEKLIDLIMKSQLSDLPKGKSGFVKEFCEVPKFDIKRGNDKDPFSLESREILKKYQVVFDKRVVDWNTLISYPFGYKK